MIYYRGGSWAFAAPEGAVSLSIGGEEGDTVTANVVDGEAVFVSMTTADLQPGEYVEEWTFADGSIERGARFQVEMSIVADGVAAVWRKPSVAAQMVEKLEGLLLIAGESAELSISTADGQSIVFENRESIARELARWKRALAKERGEGRTVKVR